MANRRVITFSLDPESITHAIMEVNRYRGDFLQRANEVIQALTWQGREHAMFEIVNLGAFSTGKLADSIKGIWNGARRVGLIYTDVYYAVFVEYGTGVVGANNPHPMPSPTWQYDVNGHGDDGWYYMADQRDGTEDTGEGETALKWHWTRGQPSRPFWYNTYRHLMQVAPDVARRIFDTL